MEAGTTTQRGREPKGEGQRDKENQRGSQRKRPRESK
jgi:hypothetical protein